MIDRFTHSFRGDYSSGETVGKQEVHTLGVVHSDMGGEPGEGLEPSWHRPWCCWLLRWSTLGFVAVLVRGSCFPGFSVRLLYKICFFWSLVKS